VFKKIKTQKVYMRIVEQITNLVEKGKLKPGDRLPPEHVLAEKFGASRPSVREALSALEILGVIESRAGRGNFIKNSLNLPSYRKKLEELEREESPFELLEARKIIESQIASLAAQRATEEDISAIQDSLNKMKNALPDIPRVMEYDRKFHINIAKAAHNSVLFSMMSYLADGLREKKNVTVSQDVLKNILKSI